MKALIVEIKEKYAAALYDNGSIIRVKNKGYHTGQVVYLAKDKPAQFKQRTAVIAASVAAVVCVCGTAYAYTDPYSYVSLDVNPSVAFQVNRFDQVIGVQGVDSDGADVLSHLDIKNKNIHEAITQTLAEIQKEGYFAGWDENGVVISACGGDPEKTGKLEESLKEDAQKTLAQGGVSADVESIGVSRQRVQEAQDMGVTPGKLNLVEKLKSSMADPASIDTQEWLNKPVRDIMKQIEQNKKEDIAPDPGNGNKALPPSDTPSAQPTAQRTPSAAPGKPAATQGTKPQNGAASPATGTSGGKGNSQEKGNVQQDSASPQNPQGTTGQTQGNNANNGGKSEAGGGGKDGNEKSNGKK